MNYKKILIAVDSSEYSLNAAQKAMDLAHQIDATVAAVCVVDASKALGNFDVGLLPGEALLALTKEAEQTLDQVGKMYMGKDLTKFMPEGFPREEIIHTAEQWEADLIVMGTHGRTGLRHLLMGSVAEYVLHHSKVPLLIVPLRNTK
ncbi:MAG: universal stress protein [Saprospiraceae bacterium]|uniref:Universal stress protein n=1 Tax=Candidatus Opimibacter skivensis TaxID=2982028 RepID=A0A9D7SPW8_9BACT|nr:universal stress protein [Candidatus Opimibacter skivensis]